MWWLATRLAKNTAAALVPGPSSLTAALGLPRSLMALHGSPVSLMAPVGPSGIPSALHGSPLSLTAPSWLLWATQHRPPLSWRRL